MKEEKERVCELDHRTIEITQTEQQVRKYTENKNEQRLRSLRR